MARYKIQKIKLAPHEYDNKVSGVYLIECIANGKKYVGATASIRMRFAQHKSRLNKGLHPNLGLQIDWNIYGQEGFTFSVMEYCKYKLWEKERIYNLQVPEDKRYSHTNRNRKATIKRRKRHKP